MPWTTISDATLEVGKALRALTMRNLRDNITALANGDAGAPQIQTAAIAAGVVTNAKLAANSVAAGNISDGNVTTAKIADYNVTTEKIASGAVAAWTASLGTGGIGTYAFLRKTGLNPTAGSTYSTLTYSGITSGGLVHDTGGAAGGTWLAMGSTNASGATLFLRIS